MPTLERTKRIAEVVKLRKQGRTGEEIEKLTGESKRQVWRLLKEAKESGQYEGLSDWTVPQAMALGHSEEKIRWLFDLNRQITVDEANFAWIVHNIRPGLPASLALEFGQAYDTAVGDRGENHEWRLRFIDITLRSAPWIDDDRAEQYFGRMVAISAPPDLRFVLIFARELRWFWDHWSSQAERDQCELENAWPEADVEATEEEVDDDDRIPIIPPAHRPHVDALMKAYRTEYKDSHFPILSFDHGTLDQQEKLFGKGF